MYHSKLALSGMAVFLLWVFGTANYRFAEGRADSAVDLASDSLEATVLALTRAFEGTVGVAAYHIESGRSFGFNENERFPMASVYKLPIAIAVLHQVDTGRLRLDSTVTVRPIDFAPHHSPLAQEAAGQAVRRTVEQLMVAMLGYSDNTASDVLLHLAGGAPAVQKHLTSLGIEGVRVDRSEREMALDRSGVGSLPEGTTWSREGFHELENEVPADRRARAQQSFLGDARDTAIPAKLVKLLRVVHEGASLSATSHELLLKIMAASPTGGNRIKAFLPPGTPVAHKTGTWEAGIATNDVGIITLPDNGGHVAVAIFVKNAGAEEFSRRERIIAEIAAAVYSSFAGRAGSSPDLGTNRYGPCPTESVQYERCMP